jgi:chromosome segregation ATPase
LTPQECLYYRVPFGSRLILGDSPSEVSNGGGVFDVSKKTQEDEDIVNSRAAGPQISIGDDGSTTVDQQIQAAEIERTLAMENNTLKHELQLKSNELKTASSKLVSMQSMVDNMVAKDLTAQGDLAHCKMEIRQLKALIDTMVPKTTHDECRDQLSRLEKTLLDLSAKSIDALAPDAAAKLRADLQQKTDELAALRASNYRPPVPDAVAAAAAAAHKEEATRLHAEAAALAARVDALQAAFTTAQADLAAARAEATRLALLQAESVPSAELERLRKMQR